MEVNAVRDQQDDIEATAVKFLHSGYVKMTIDAHSLEFQSSPSLLIDKIAASGDYDDVAAVKDGTSIAYTRTADGIALSTYLHKGILAQAVTWARYMYRTPSPAFWEPHTNTALALWIQYFEYGVLEMKMPWMDNDEATTTNIEEALKGLNHHDDGAGTNSSHDQWIKRFAYLFGLKRSGDLPNIVEKATDSTFTYRHRWIVVRSIRDTRKITDLFPVGALASDKAAFSLGNFVNRYIPSHIPKEMHNTAVEDIWAWVISETKQDVLASNVTNHKSFITDFFDYSYLANTNYDASNRLSALNIYVDADALKIGRMLFGIGRTEISGEEYHFCNLLNIAVETSGGAYDTHMIDGGTKKWFVGINTALVIDYFSQPDLGEDGWPKYFEKILKFDHWTGSTLKGMADDLVVTDVRSAVKGTAEKDVYRPLQAIVHYTDSDANRATNLGWMDACDYPNPQDCQSSGSVKYGATAAGIQATPWSAMFLWFVQGALKNQDGLGWYLDNWTEAEMAWGAFMTYLFGTASTTMDGSERFKSYRIMLTHFIDGRTGTPDTLAYATVDTVRIGHLKNPINITNYQGFAIKYTFFLLDRDSKLSSDAAIYQAQRPRGIKDASSKRRHNIGAPITQRDFLRSTIMATGSGGETISSKTTSNNVPDDPAPPTEVKDDD
jgi:hypothetical protein